VFIGLIFTRYAFAFSPFNSKPYLTPTSSPTTSIYINWNTETEESTIVAYGLTISLEDTIRTVGIRYYHQVELTALNPETEYYYQILPGGDIKQFKTFPLQKDTFSFVAFGDTRSDSIAHQSVIDRMAAYEFEFFMHGGDLVNDGNNTSDWRTYLNVEDTLLQIKQFLPAIGNHEFPYWPYDTLFALPDSEEYYAVDFGRAHFITLNTEMDLYGSQRTWLENDLVAASSDTSIYWIFVNFHRPPYSSGSHGSQMDVRNAWCSLFETYDVDLVFSGHDHDYERTIPVNDVVYIVTGGGGAPLRHVDSTWFTAYSESTYHFCLIELMTRKLILKAIKPDGTVFDSLIMNKTQGIEEKSMFNDNEDIFFSPNPFVNNLAIKYVISVRQNVQLKIYDSAGRWVKILTDGPQGPGAYTIFWAGVDESGSEVDSGIYFLIFVHGDQNVKRKIIKID
jgi:hypothetical protein